MTDPNRAGETVHDHAGDGPGPVSVLGHWSGTDIRATDITDALGHLALKARQSLALRTSVLTLVVRPDDREEAEFALATLRDFGAQRPARTVVLITDHQGPSSMDAEVTLYEGRTGDVRTWGEDVVLTLRGEVGRHLPSVLRGLVIPDLPVAVWYPAAVPDVDNPLQPLGSAVLVDSKFADDDPGGTGLPEVLRAVSQVIRQAPVVDLSWLRLRAWREPLARLFEGPELRPFIQGVTGVEITGNRGPRTLLAGWLGSRLGLDPALIRMTSGPHAGITLQAEHGGRTATFGVQRVPGERLVGASAEVDGGGLKIEAVTPIEPPGLRWSLSRAITEPRQHPIYESAVKWAVVNYAAGAPTRA